jgi:hypothetical protein
MLNAFISKLFMLKAVEAELARGRTQGKHGVSELERALRGLGIGLYTPSQLEAYPLRTALPV